MSTPDITKAISDNPIKNGGSLLHINKTGIEITFDNSRDIEPGLDALSPETTDRFDDRLYYGVSSGDGGNPFNQELNTTNSPTFNRLSLSSGIVFNDGTTQTTAASGVSGSLVIPTASIDLHNGGVQTAQVLQFDDNSKQSIITGPTPPSGNNSQRIIIQGQRAQGNGEGGDVYLWGGDANYNGGDIKIYAGDADNVSPDNGYGGYVNIDGGKGATNGGNVEITAGYSEGGQAGYVSIVGGPTSNGIAGNVTIQTNNSTKTWTFGADGTLNTPGIISLPNYTTVATGTFDNSTGGNNGISLNCYVGYELNWQGGHLKSTQDGGISAANIWCDSAIEFQGSGIDNMQIDSSGITYPDGTTQNSANISTTNITNFNTAVSGLIPTTAAESEKIVTTVFNKTGSTIPKFRVVYINGGQGDMPTISLASSTQETTSSKTYGITAEAIDHMSTGKLIVDGALTGLDTDQFNPSAPTGDVNGTILYLGTASGLPTTTKPSAPNHIVAIGTIVRTHQNEGVVEVRIQNGFELQELHNVAISSVSHNDILVYNSGTSLWQNNSMGVFSNPSGIAGASSITNIVSISQTDYDALVTKNSSTLYIIS